MTAVNNYLRTALASGFFLAAISCWASAAELSDLQSVKAGDFRTNRVFAAGPVPVPQAGSSLAILENPAILDEFSNSFGYKVNGKIRFPYRLEHLHFYKLTGWPGYLLVQVEDISLPEFHNFIVLKAAPGHAGGYQVVYRFDSQTEAAAYSAAVPAEALCSLDPDCGRLNELKKRAEVREMENAGAWENFYFEAVKAKLAQRVGDKFDSGKYSLLQEVEIQSAKKRVESTIIGTTGGGRAGILASVEADWKAELCGVSSTDFIERLRQAAVAEQEKMVLRCGFYQDADWVIKKEYASILTARLHSSCKEGVSAAANRDYCGIYNTWNEHYTRITGMVECKIAGGTLSF